MSSDEALAALATALPSGALIRDPDIVQGLSHDDAEWAPFGEPLAVVRATSSTEVAAAVRICAGFGVPVTARGAGTGLSGGQRDRRRGDHRPRPAQPDHRHRSPGAVGRGPGRGDQ